MEEVLQQDEPALDPEPLKPALSQEHQDAALRMAHSLLRKWRCQISKDDVQGMAGVAIVKAAQQFDPSHGTKFESFLFYYIKAELIKTIEGAVKAKKAVEALRDVVPDFEDSHQTPSKKSDKNAAVLPDPDRISASPAISPERKMIIDERNEILRQALTRLDEEHRTILELVYFKQTHPQKIKEILGLSRSGIKTALSRARRALEKELRSTSLEGYFN